MEEFGWDGRAPQNRFNRNPLLSLGIGADGLKTGRTEEAGFGLVGSALQGNRRIVFVISGLDTNDARAEEAERIVAWAFRQFVQKDIAREGDIIAQAPVWLGARSSVGLAMAQDLTLLVPALSQERIEAEVRYRGPVEAPIDAGEVLAELIIRLPDLPETRVPLVADRAVAEGGFMPRVRLAAQILADRIAGRAAEMF
ncbi:MAG: D-alanyl-D-alanine carboxypeptidase, partial [Pseudomonadota bacterium]